LLADIGGVALGAAHDERASGHQGDDGGRQAKSHDRAIDRFGAPAFWGFVGAAQSGG
jgi:hypothetical protein